ncbi:homogentisate 1,2-dioxygenase-like isoform X6 [Lineus longissimus]|uniref:homogentisate 1,2-dioxygenase-like isoform X6 n=1 Tax=Lineus longissimus TaxID=88925 RepID=UPI00315D27B8
MFNRIKQKIDKLKNLDEKDLNLIDELLNVHDDDDSSNINRVVINGAEAKKDKNSYLTGFGNEFSSEDPRCPGALSKTQNNPQKCNYGLYAEQLTGSAFTSPRNQRSWLYRIRPSVCHTPFKRIRQANFTNDWLDDFPNPNQLRWHPFDVPKKEEKEVDFVRGLATLCGAGDPRARNGVGVHVYLCNISMGDRCFYNSDGDFLIVPQQGVLHLVTEFGKMQVSPGEICVLQQGIRFNVAVEGESRGYIMEVFNSHFELPNLGVVGANGLASPRHFLTPVAWYEDRDNVTYSVITKFQGALFMADQNHSPFDVVAWHGNYAPFKYNLKNFQVMGSVSFDTPDSSLYTVLTCPSRTPGIPAASFTICPPRWHCAEKTFKKPYFHRSAMSEVIGLLYGQYEGKNSKFRPGGACLHGMMSAHGPDTETYEKGASTNDVKPARIGDGSLAFKFESSFSMSVTKWGNEACNKVDHEYFLCWQNMKRNFNPDDKPDEGELAPLSNKSTHEPMSLASPNRSKASRGIFPYGPQVPSGSQD